MIDPAELSNVDGGRVGVGSKCPGDRLRAVRGAIRVPAEPGLGVA